MIHITDDIINFCIAVERMAGTSTLAAKLELYNRGNPEHIFNQREIRIELRRPITGVEMEYWLSEH